jgi:hypothetical protein
VAHGEPRDARTVGRTAEAGRANALVIDGQQRLTSLFAVIKGAEVIDKDGEKRRIKIAFRPRDGRFEVPDAAIRNDPEFVADVSELWSGKRSKPQIRKDLLAGLKAKQREIDPAYENAVEHNLDRVHSIGDFRFPVVDIRKTAQNEEATEEDVAEIFVRINNQGMRLGQADFVLTLLRCFTAPCATRSRSARRRSRKSRSSRWTRSNSCAPPAPSALTAPRWRRSIGSSGAWIPRPAKLAWKAAVRGWPSLTQPSTLAFTRPRGATTCCVSPTPAS